MIIYKYTNKINGKQYIGQTIQGFRNRHTQHMRDSVTYFDRALSKYGEENFDWEIIYEATDIDDLNLKEIEMIKKYNTLKPNGYNITLGGNSFSGYSHSDETRRKISKAIKNFYKNNPERALSGEKSPVYGIKWSADRKNQMSEIKQEFWKNNHKAREEMSEIKKAHYRDNPELRELKSRQAKDWIAKHGHHLKGKKHTEETKMKLSKALRGRKMSEEAKAKIKENNPRKRKVINLDTGEIFDTIMLASQSIGRNKSGVSNACRGNRPTCGGYRWAYLDKYQADQTDTLDSIMEMEKQGEQGK